jgi:type IV secretion system protein TrbG
MRRVSPVIAYLMIVGPVSAQTDTTGTSDAVVYAYGHAQPVVTCAPLYACVVELEAGERVLATGLGDPERWVVEQAVGGSRTPLVIVKPTACDLATNLVVATDRRIYDLALEAPVCSRRSVRYTRRVRFSYSGVLTVPSPLPDTFHPESLAFVYRWRPDKRAAWSPVAVYDDGAHVYVRLPGGARHSDLPVLLLELDDGSRAIVNYVVTNDAYVTDRVFARAILRDGSREIEIVNTQLWLKK